MSSPPRKRSIQFSPHDDAPDERARIGSSARPYRENLTPHPKKLSDASSYFEDVQGAQGDVQPTRDYPTPHPKKLSDASSYFDGVRPAHGGSGAGSGTGSGSGIPPVPPLPPSEPPKAAVFEHPKRSGLLRRSSTMDSEIRERHATERAQVEAGRAALLRRSSSMDSRGTGTTAADRSFSALEEGGERRARRNSSAGGGVVGAFLRFGRGRLPSGGLHVPKVHVPGDFKVASTASLYDSGEKQVDASGTSAGYQERAKQLRERRSSQITKHVEDYVARQKFVLRLAKALLSFGAPSHRIESQLGSAGEILDMHVAFVHLPGLIMVTFLDSDTRTSETHFVRAGGRVALTALHRVHAVYRDVLHDKIGATEGCEQLKRILQARPLYDIWTRCLLAFFCASIICVLSFGGSIVDMFVSGLSASVLQYLGLNAAAKSSI